MEFEAVIGLEVHSQLKTNTKIFCGCANKFGAPQNTNVCPICLGMPGVLPVLNKTAVEYAIKTAIGLECKISPISIFARKHYFYPDLPKNFQISQYELPLAEHGVIELESGKKIGVTRVHMEEDAGKLLHSIGQRQIDGSYVDLNRTGTPLVEIVSEPDISTPEEAYEYLTTLKSILEYLEISDCNMEEGSLRCDANISIRPKGEKKLGTKSEIKNMNSFRGVQKALEHEIDRQIELVESGARVVQETRLWDAKTETTASMRSKEGAHDYRYFPEPDLPPLKVDQAWIDDIKSKMPELPKQREARFIEQFNLSEYDADVLTKDKKLADYFENCLEFVKDKNKDNKLTKMITNWIMVELLGKLNNESKTIEQTPVTAENLANLIILIDNNTISGKIGKTVFEEMFIYGKKPNVIIKEKNLVQITDSSQIESIVDEVLKESTLQLEQYRGGKEQLFGFFVGQVMKKSKGKANPAEVNKILKEKLI
ncbi:Asp-tRNA(Asn)/Glu-tRNA(Gln) amidotransferase subunit GatB [bacterium]